MNTHAFNTEGLRKPPYSLNAEQSLLGGLMLDNEAWNKIADQVNMRNFYRKEHRLIFQTVAFLAEDGQPFDIVTLAELLERRGELEAAGGFIAAHKRITLPKESEEFFLDSTTGTEDFYFIASTTPYQP